MRRRSRWDDAIDTTKHMTNAFPYVMTMETSPGTLSAVPMGGKTSHNHSQMRGQVTRQICPRNLSMTMAAMYMDLNMIPATSNPRAPK